MIAFFVCVSLWTMSLHIKWRSSHRGPPSIELRKKYIYNSHLAICEERERKKIGDRLFSSIAASSAYFSFYKESFLLL